MGGGMAGFLLGAQTIGAVGGKGGLCAGGEVPGRDTLCGDAAPVLAVDLSSSSLSDAGRLSPSASINIISVNS
jgi:hypothetical protein